MGIFVQYVITGWYLYSRETQISMVYRKLCLPGSFRSKTWHVALVRFMQVSSLLHVARSHVILSVQMCSGMYYADLGI